MGRIVMTGIAGRFFASAIIYIILGMTLGLVMGMTQDHAQMPTHAHILVIGWVTFAIYGFFYHTFPNAAVKRLANAHFWLAEISLVVLLIGLLMIFGGRPETGDPLAAAGSVGVLISTILFAVIAWPVVRSSSPSP
jgi:heme/copper-type cytochrome/quinol oxidase subunit 1